MGIETIDVGDRVNCDWCNKEWTRDMTEEGGLLWGSKASCPTCAPGIRLDAKKFDEENFIKAEQPKGVTFHAWVMSLRGGDNTVRVYTGDDAVRQLLRK